MACLHLVQFREQDWRAPCGNLIPGQLARSWGAVKGLAASSRAHGAVKAGCPSFCPSEPKQHPAWQFPSHQRSLPEALPMAMAGLQEQCKAAWAGLALCSHMVLGCTFPQTSCTSQINTYWAKLRNASFWRLFPSAHHKGYTDLATLLRSEWKHCIAGKQTHVLLIKAIHAVQKIPVWRATGYICTSTRPVL